jgi:hypothetical protein
MERAEMKIWLALCAVFWVQLSPGAVNSAAIEEAEFLVLIRGDNNDRRIFMSKIVPLVPDRVCYGWRIRLTGAKDIVKFKEVFSLPTEPRIWGGENDKYSTSSVEKNRKTTITEEFAPVRGGWISNMWCVANGDPEGQYSMDVHIDGVFLKRFDFELRTMPKMIQPP